MSDYSPWFVRDRAFSSSKGVLVFLNEEKQMKLNKKSVFIAALENQHEYQFQSFKSIQVPLVRFPWYVLKNCGYNMKDFLSIPNYVDNKRIEIEEKKAAALKLVGQQSLEIETEKSFQIKNCSHKYDLVSAGDFETCYKCKMRRCAKCEEDLSFVKRLNDIVRHYGSTNQKMQQILGLGNVLEHRVYCVGPDQEALEGYNGKVKNLEEWLE